jgi:hypothetical protein
VSGDDRRAPAWPARVLGLAAAAVVLRLLLLLGRGDYLAFDEGWYLLLARSLFTGDGYSLIGIPHITLSPLFPILAGAVGTLVDSWVWGGRIVAATASGLVVLPAWSVYRRLAGPRTAFVAAGLVAILPSMAPFVVPFWIGADLWVGAEPLLHLLLYAGVATWLAADEKGGLARWALAGAFFGLAFLARPEAIITWGLLGLAALALAAASRSPRRLMGAVAMGLGLLVVAAPYWARIHEVSGQWSLTGRGVAPMAALRAGPDGEGRGGAAGGIERMLWADDDAYERSLYGLDDSGLRLRSDYWGVYPETEAEPGAAGRAPGGGAGDTVAAAQGGPEPGGPQAPATAPADPPSAVTLFLRALGQIVPLLLWPFVVLGVVRRREPGTLRRELPVAVALVGTSLAIAVLVAVDARTQLFLVPLLALYAARGFALVEEVVRDRVGSADLRPGFIEAVVVGVAVVWLLGINGRRLYMSLTVGSPHHVVAQQNREVAESLDRLLDSPSGPVASWHPAIAVFADRDWRVLPFASLPAIVRYEQAAGATGMVLSAYYPPPLRVEELGTRYLILEVPPAPTSDPSPPSASSWNLRIEHADTIITTGRLLPSP